MSEVARMTSEDHAQRHSFNVGCTREALLGYGYGFDAVQITPGYGDSEYHFEPSGACGWPSIDSVNPAPAPAPPMVPGRSVAYDNTTFSRDPATALTGVYVRPDPSLKSDVEAQSFSSAYGAHSDGHGVNYQPRSAEQWSETTPSILGPIPEDRFFGLQETSAEDQVELAEFRQRMLQCKNKSHFDEDMLQKLGNWSGNYDAASGQHYVVTSPTFQHFQPASDVVHPNMYGLAGDAVFHHDGPEVKGSTGTGGATHAMRFDALSRHGLMQAPTLAREDNFPRTSTASDGDMSVSRLSEASSRATTPFIPGSRYSPLSGDCAVVNVPRRSSSLPETPQAQVMVPLSTMPSPNAVAAPPAFVPIFYNPPQPYPTGRRHSLPHQVLMAQNAPIALSPRFAQKAVDADIQEHPPAIGAGRRHSIPHLIQPPPRAPPSTASSDPPDAAVVTQSAPPCRDSAPSTVSARRGDKKPASRAGGGGAKEAHRRRGRAVAAGSATGVAGGASERQYRERLNAQFDLLLEVLPQEADEEQQHRIEAGGNGSRADKGTSKASILERTRNYLQLLGQKCDEERRLMAKLAEGMEGQGNMAAKMEVEV